MSRTDPVPLTDVRCALGEGPSWDAEHGLVRWVDIEAGHVWAAAVDGAGLGPARLAHDCGPMLGAAAFTLDGGLLLARTRHLEHVDAAGRTVGRLELVPAGVASRLNDGAADPAGRYVVGSMAMDGRTGGERLWRVEHDGSLTVLDDDLTLANGLGWSPDGSLLYTVDSVAATVWVRDYDPDGRHVGPRRLFLALHGDTPDGLTVDGEGNLWLALWGAGEVRCLSSEARLLDVVRTGAPLTTSCAFVGPGLDLLVITTAAQDAPGVVQTERAGTLLGLRPGVTGRPTTPWRPVPLQAGAAG